MQTNQYTTTITRSKTNHRFQHSILHERNNKRKSSSLPSSQWLSLTFSILLLNNCLLLQAHNVAVDKHCGTRIPSPDVIHLDQARMKSHVLHINENNNERRLSSIFPSSCEELCTQCIEIETYFHYFALPIGNTNQPNNSTNDDNNFVLPHPTAIAALPFAYKSFYTSVDTMNAMVKEQMIVLNQAFNATPFRFRHMNPDNPSIAVNRNYTIFALDYAEEMSAEYGIGGDLKILNVFLSLSVRSREDSSLSTGTTTQQQEPDAPVGETVAFATFPSYQQLNSGDGVFQRFDTLPGGGFPGTESGLTLAHEVGHWLGLYHPFQRNINFQVFDDHHDNDNIVLGPYDPCDPADQNDFVQDTPQMAGPTYDYYNDCTALLNDDDDGSNDSTIADTCPTLEGSDPVFNYMNYLDNEQCLVEKGGFTCGQILRMYMQWFLYRDQVEKCESESEMEIELVAQFDAEWHLFENSFYLQTADGEIIFNSTIDHTEIGTAVGHDTLSLDLCVPKGTYIFVYEDSAGDGFTPGSGSYFEIFLNGKSYAKVTENFGALAAVRITESWDGVVNSNTDTSFNNDGINTANQQASAAAAATLSQSKFLVFLYIVWPVTGMSVLLTFL